MSNDALIVAVMRANALTMISSHDANFDRMPGLTCYAPARASLSIAMTLTVEAVYENGVLNPTQPLPLAEHAKVQLTIQPQASGVAVPAGVVNCSDPHLIVWAALDAELVFPTPPAHTLPVRILSLRRAQ